MENQRKEKIFKQYQISERFILFLIELQANLLSYLFVSNKSNLFSIMTQVPLWSTQEDNLLASLRELSIVCVKVSWRNVTAQFNQKTNTSRTVSQCKERYEKVLKKQKFIMGDWSRPQLELLKQLYLDHGPVWLKITEFLKNRGQTNTKNRFYCTIKRGCKRLSQIEKSLKKVTNKTINLGLISVLLDLSNRIKKWALEKGLTLDQNSKIFKMRKEIIQFCFQAEETSPQSLIFSIKQICFNLRFCNFFKARYKKDWKLTWSNLRTIFLYDKFIVQKQQFHSLMMTEGRKCKQPQVDSTKEIHHQFVADQQSLESLSYEPLGQWSYISQVLQLSSIQKCSQELDISQLELE